MRTVVGRISAELGSENYRVDVRVGDHTLIADEPVARAGKGSGPAVR